MNFTQIKKSYLYSTKKHQLLALWPWQVQKQGQMQLGPPSPLIVSYLFIKFSLKMLTITKMIQVPSKINRRSSEIITKVQKKLENAYLMCLHLYNSYFGSKYMSGDIRRLITWFYLHSFRFQVKSALEDTFSNIIATINLEGKSSFVEKLQLVDQLSNNWIRGWEGDMGIFSINPKLSFLVIFFQKLSNYLHTNILFILRTRGV